MESVSELFQLTNIGNIFRCKTIPPMLISQNALMFFVILEGMTIHMS